MARKSWTDTTPQKVAQAVVDVAKAVTGPIVRAVTSQVSHICDPTGFRCDCARRAEINSRSSGGKKNWIPKRKGWLR